MTRYRVRRSRLARSKWCGGLRPLASLALAVLAFGTHRAQAQQQPNDACTDRSAVFDGPTSFSTIGATTDGGAVACGFGPAFNDVWFSYVPSSTGILDISLCDSSFDTVLAVYDDCLACPPVPLSEIACSDDDCGLQSKLVLPVVQGQCYTIRVGGFDASDRGSAVLTVTPLSALNDDCANAQVIGDGTTAFDLTGATPDGPTSLCVGTPSVRDVWFAYTPACTGILYLELLSANGSFIGWDLYDTCTCPVTSSATIACWPFPTTRVIPVTAGQCLLFRVGSGYYGDGNGPGTITLNCFPPPPNDDCAASIPITDGPTAYDLHGATMDGPSNTNCSFPVGADVWFSYVATCTGAVRITAPPDLYGHKIVVYADDCQPGTCLATHANEVACIPVGGGGTGAFQTIAGQCFKIRVAGFGSPTSVVGMMTLVCFPLPPNDDCAAATPIFDGSTPYDATGATLDGPATACSFPAFTRDVWYSYTATCTGTIRVTVGQEFSTVPTAIYADCGPGTCPPSSAELGCASSLSGATAPVVAGQCYKIRMGPIHQGPSTINIVCNATPQNDLCTDHVPVTDGTTSYTTVGASTDGTSTGCGDIVGDVWFDYTAICSGLLSVAVIDSNFSAVVAVYDGCATGACPPAVELACGFVFSPLLLPVVAGQCYKIRIGTSYTAPGTGTLTLSCSGAPGNDNCGAAQLANTGVTPFTPASATLDGPPVSCGFGFDFVADVWFDYTATCTGKFSVGAGNEAGSSYGMAVYSGCDCQTVSQATEVGCNAYGIGSAVLVDAIAGQCFKIRVGSGYTGELSGQSALYITCHSPPLNDDCGSAQSIGNGETSYDSTMATTDGPGGACTIPEDVWFDYIATCDGYLVISEIAGGYPLFAMYDGCSCVPLEGTEITCGGIGPFPAFVPIQAGHCYKLRIGGTPSQVGVGTLRLSCLDLAPNDACANRISLELGTTAFSTVGATTDGIQSHGLAWNDLWYDFTPPCDGDLTASLCASSFNTSLFVYKGCYNVACPPTAIPVASSYDFCGYNAEATLPVLGGQCYKIRIGSETGEHGLGSITLSLAAPDADADGSFDCEDGCPTDPAKSAPGQCGCGVVDSDTDLDGTADCIDGCPTDPNKIAPGECGCGVADTDSDGDATADCFDGCPADPNKVAPGICGCGIADTDTDGDTTADCNDGCPDDPLKIAPGTCGCGVAETDADGDSISDCIDNCSAIPNLFQDDDDADGVGDVCDNCPTVTNPSQTNADGDPTGDACDPCTDTDGDGFGNPGYPANTCPVDGCPNDPLKSAPGACGCGVPDTDTDGDATVDCIDGCPDDPLKIAPGSCGCGVADTDADGDSISDCIDNCSAIPNLFQDDADADGVGDVCDNCVSVGNPGQADCNNDSVGDACEIANGAPDCNQNGVPDLCDIANATSLDQNANSIPDECETNGGTPYCFGYSSCPCGNNSAAGSGQGCVNSTGQGAILLGSGQSSLSNDQLALTASNLPIPGTGSGFALFFQGNAASNAPFRDGLRCVAGSQVRLGTQGHLSGTTSYPQGGDLPVSVKGMVTAPGARYYQAWYRNVLGPCGAGSNLSNGVSVIWIP